MTQEYYARVDSKYQGNTIFSVPFPYLHKNNIQVLINDKSTTDYTWLNSSQINISATMQIGDDVSIIRVTPINEKEVTFSNDSILDKDAQNKQHDQMLYSMQELYDTCGTSLIDLADLNQKTEELASEAQELLEIANSTLEKATEQANKAEQYASSTEIGMRWVGFTSDDWAESSGKYTLTLENVAIVNAIYKGASSDKKLIKNCDINVTASGCVITSLDAFNGYALTNSNVLED